MRIGTHLFFQDRLPPIYTVDEIPLGGHESAVSYLARSLAQAGHDVFFFWKNVRDRQDRRSELLNLNATEPQALRAMKPARDGLCCRR